MATERGDLVAILDALPRHVGYRVALRVSERVAMMHDGRVLKEGSPAEIEADPDVQRIYLGGGDG